LEALILQGTGSPEVALRQAFALLPDADLDKIGEALDRSPDHEDRIARDSLTPDEKESFDRLAKLVELQVRDDSAS
jgi:hypothetical protein